MRVLLTQHIQLRYTGFDLVLRSVSHCTQVGLTCVATVLGSANGFTECEIHTLKLVERRRLHDRERSVGSVQKRNGNPSKREVVHNLWFLPKGATTNSLNMKRVQQSRIPHNIPPPCLPYPRSQQGQPCNHGVWPTAQPLHTIRRHVARSTSITGDAVCTTHRWTYLSKPHVILPKELVLLICGAFECFPRTSLWLAPSKR